MVTTQHLNKNVIVILKNGEKVKGKIVPLYGNMCVFLSNDIGFQGLKQHITKPYLYAWTFPIGSYPFGNREAEVKSIVIDNTSKIIEVW